MNNNLPPTNNNHQQSPTVKSYAAAAAAVSSSSSNHSNNQDTSCGSGVIMNTTTTRMSNDMNTTTTTTMNGTGNDYNGNHNDHDNNHNDDNGDNDDDCMVLALAFVRAQDEDIFLANNALSSSSSSSGHVVINNAPAKIPNLQYYIISTNWFRKVWPILNLVQQQQRTTTTTAANKNSGCGGGGGSGTTTTHTNNNKNWKQEIVGPIDNTSLLLLDDGNGGGVMNDIGVSGGNNNNVRGGSSSSSLAAAALPAPAFLDELKQQQKRFPLQQEQSHHHQQQQQQPPNGHHHHHHHTDHNKSYFANDSPNDVDQSLLQLNLRTKLQYGVDYVLVGSNVWLLLKSKFGLLHKDHEIPCPKCVLTRMPCRQLDVVVVEKTIATVPMLADDKRYGPDICIGIPPSGRFDYDMYISYVNKHHRPQEAAVPLPPSQLLSNNNNNNIPPPANNNNNSDGGSGSAMAVATADDENNNNNDNNTDDDDDDDLFPGLNDDDNGSQKMSVSSSDQQHHVESNNRNGFHGRRLDRPLAHIDPDNDENHRPGDDGNKNNNNNEDGPILFLPPPRNNNAPQQQQQDDMMVPVVRRRRYGSGLGNLGNTCFMNSTLQCLAHTEPLQRYFLTGDFQRDLNRHNILGTGGELASQFAQLLYQMFAITSASGGGGGWYGNRNGDYDDVNDTCHVVYPRDFKITLGRHAEQFMGYDQHDSQELATYLLDALHEDCNRVTNKPYIEKPEQGEEESDQEASDKAWDLHLQREDSRVLENFMGQVKSRVQCCQEDCGRVSTTFDPFMFLSVPIPGSEERSIAVTYVSTDPAQRPIKVSVKVSKTASTVDELVKKLFEKLKELGSVEDVPADQEDVAVCDVWQKKVYEWRVLSQDTDKIRDNDETVVYQLRSLKEIQEREKNNAEAAKVWGGNDDATAERLGIRNLKRTRQYKLDLATLTCLNHGDSWYSELQRYSTSPHHLLTAFDPTKGSSDDRVRIYRRLVNFINECHKVLEKVDDAAGQKRARDDYDQNGNGGDHDNGDGVLMNGDRGTLRETISHSPVPEIIESNDLYSSSFRNVKSKQDVAILEFLAGKAYKEIMSIETKKRSAFPDGVQIEVQIREISGIIKAAPFVLRIPSDMTVYALRQEIAYRLSRSLKTGPDQTMLGYPGETMDSDGYAIDSPESFIVNQIPMGYACNGSYRSSFQPWKQLGSISKPGTELDGTRSNPFAQPTQDDEKVLVAEKVGHQGTVFLDWPADLAYEAFDEKEYLSVDEPMHSEAARKDKITVLDCIDKYCQMEQLEESERWYCSRCKDHVRAWKQFHIYRSPPHLIVHLKRFQFSARTHRRQKINEDIDFPLEGLDLSGHVLHWDEGEKPIYDCYAVSNHYGGLGGGHYTAYCLNDGGEWCLYDDSRIETNVDPERVVSQVAYVLYYRRRDVLVDRDFEMSLPTPDEPERRPVIIQDAPGITTKQQDSSSTDPPSSSAAMVADDDDEENRIVGDVADGSGSRSTSPASLDAVQDDYSYEDDDDSNWNTTDPSLPLQ